MICQLYVYRVMLYGPLPPSTIPLMWQLITIHQSMFLGISVIESEAALNSLG